jgi:protein-disulfide isomerase
MTLKDRLNEALAAVPADNAHRAGILRAILAAEGDDGDAELQAAIGRMIDAMETKASAFEAAGHAPEATAEREEIKVLRQILGGPQTASKAKKTGSSLPGPKLTQRQMVFGGIAIATAAVAGLLLWQPWSSGEETASTDSNKIAVFNDDRTLGDPKAPIVLLEYAAPTCPHCAHFALTGLPGLKRDFFDKGKVFYIFRVYPLRAADGAVEGIARCLPPERYFTYIDRMFREQPQWDPDGYVIPDVEGAIVRLAAAEGLGPERIKQCMTDMRQQERTNEVAQDAVAKYQLEATPTFVMDGEVVTFPPGQELADVLRLRINSLLKLKGR